MDEGRIYLYIGKNILSDNYVGGNMQNRFKSKVLWISIATQVISILISVGAIADQSGEIIKTIIISLCELFVTFGILNNPTSPDTL